MPGRAAGLTVEMMMSCPTRPFPPTFPPPLRRGERHSASFSWGLRWRVPPVPRVPLNSSRPPGSDPRRSPSCLLLFPLFRKRGGTGGTVLESGGKAGAMAFPLGGTGRGNARNGRCCRAGWAPPRAVAPVRPSARGREIALGSTGPHPLRGPALRQPCHVFCACPANTSPRGYSRGSEGLSAHPFRP